MDAQAPLVFDADAPSRPRPKQRAVPHAVWMPPDLWREIEAHRGKLSKSRWIARAVLRELAREQC